VLFKEENQLLEQEIKEVSKKASLDESPVKAPPHSVVSSANIKKDKKSQNEIKNDIDKQKSMFPAFKASLTLKKENAKLSLHEDQPQRATKMDTQLDIKQKPIEVSTSDNNDYDDDDEDDDDYQEVMQTQNTYYVENLAPEMINRESSFVKRGKCTLLKATSLKLF
jgi:hypothetical protein